MNRGPTRFKKELSALVAQESSALTEIMRRTVSRLYTEYLSLEEEIAGYEKELTALFKQSEDCQRLSTIPGIGLLSALAITALIGDMGHFKNARHLSAYLGLVPRQHSSGGKERRLGISKQGNAFVRTLLIHGARSVLQRVDKHDDRRSRWLKELSDRIGFNKTCVALANKQARAIGAVLSRKKDYQTDHYKTNLPLGGGNS